MKKTLIIIIVVFTIIAALLVRLITGGSTEKAEIHEGFSKVGIESGNIEIEVLPSDTLTTVVELAGDDNDDFRLETKVKEDTLVVEVKRKGFKWFNFGFFNDSTTLKVYLPKKKYEWIEAANDNGFIHVSGVEANEIHIDTDNGKIELYDLKTTILQTKTDNGKIIMENVTGDITGIADNGEISLITKTLDRNIDLETDNGAIEIKTKQEPKNVQFDIKVDNGTVSVFGNSNYDTIIGNGDNIVRLKTDNGHIKID